MTKKSLSTANIFAPENIIPDFHMEADGRGKSISLLVSGVLGVKSFSECDVLIVTKRESINISGTLLQISVMESKRVLISGKIENISFSHKKKARQYENR